MNPTHPTIGIDMSQATFWAALRLDQHRVLKKEFTNNRTGFTQLGRWVQQHGLGKVRAAVESTNVYAEPLLQWLYERGHEVFLLNPERVVHYARSLGVRNKTDCADCVTIATYIALHEATPWAPPPPEQKALRSLTRTREQLVAMATTLACQRKTVSGAAREHLDALYDTVRNHLKQLEQQIKAHLAQHPTQAEQVRRLRTVKGVGLITAAIMVAELPPITEQTDPRTIAAWAGLTPRRHQSGNNTWRTHISRKGNAYVRDALYMPALVAKRYNPILRQFADRLKANGKTTNAILGAIAHKMLRIFVGLLRSNTDFDPNWSFKKT